MSRDWKLTFFVPELEFGEDTARRLLDVAADAGFSPISGGGEVHLVEWWVSEEGGFSLAHSSNGMDFFMSVASPEGPDAVPLTWLAVTISALGQQVLEAADLLGLDPILRNGYSELFLTSEPSEETFDSFVSANRQWGTPLGAR